MLKVYLSSPYSNLDHEQAYRRAFNLTGILLENDINAYSPIVYCHQMRDLGTTTEFWWKFNKEWIDWCDLLVVFAIPGWEKSNGVAKEIKYAYYKNKKVTYIREQLTIETIRKLKSYE